MAIGTAIIIPMSVYALCKCDLIVESNIVIEKNKKCKSFAEDDWETIKSNIKNNCYSVGDTKKIDIGELGNHTVRIANVSTPNEYDNNTFSQTACGFVVEFEDIIYQRPFMNRGSNNGGVASKLFKKLS